LRGRRVKEEKAGPTEIQFNLHRGVLGKEEEIHFRRRDRESLVLERKRTNLMEEVQAKAS